MNNRERTFYPLFRSLCYKIFFFVNDAQWCPMMPKPNKLGCFHLKNDFWKGIHLLIILKECHTIWVGSQYNPKCLTRLKVLSWGKHSGYLAGAWITEKESFILCSGVYAVKHFSLSMMPKANKLGCLHFLNDFCKVRHLLLILKQCLKVWVGSLCNPKCLTRLKVFSGGKHFGYLAGAWITEKEGFILC